MKTFSFEDGDISISNDLFREHVGFVSEESMMRWECDKKLGYLIEHMPKYHEYVQLYGRLMGLQRYCILNAHGDSRKGWVYFDDNRKSPIQAWIDEQDGKYAALLLWSCNHGSHTPKSEKSVLIVPDRDVCDIDMPNFTLLVPRIGEVDDYTIDYETQQLLERIKVTL